MTVLGTIDVCPIEGVVLDAVEVGMIGNWDWDWDWDLVCGFVDANWNLEYSMHGYFVLSV
jgi:hypothetical protein